MSASATLDRLLTIISALPAAAPFAVASSASGWNRFWSAIGATMMGVKWSSPKRLTVRSMSVVGMFIRGRSVMRSNSARSPPATSANVAGCSFFLASSSNSRMLTSSSRGASRTCSGGSHGARSRGVAGAWPLAIFAPATVPATMAPTLPSARRLLTFWSLMVSSLFSCRGAPPPRPVSRDLRSLDDGCDDICFSATT